MHRKDSVFVTDFIMKLGVGKRIHLCKYETNDLAERLNQLFESKVEIPRIRVGKEQEIETLISEEALMLGMYPRDERKDWIPRIGIIQ